MIFILCKYVLGDEKIDLIVKDLFEIKEKLIEDIVFEKFQLYINWLIDKLCEYFFINKGEKGLNYRIVFVILNLKGKIIKSKLFLEVEEFEKLFIVVKIVYFNKKNVNKESMLFGVFKFEELVNEEWEDSEGYFSV